MWTGSDVLFATKFLKHSRKIKWFYMLAMRIYAKVSDFMVQEHYVVSEHLIEELKPLKLKKRISVLIDPPENLKLYKKKKHKGFNILYYRTKGNNQIFNDWVYGYDIINEIKKIEGVHVIEINGDADMSEIYPIIDFYARPNRHDGMPRMVIECKYNDIPYYWSKSDPSIYDLKEAIFKVLNNESISNNDSL